MAEENRNELVLAIGRMEGKVDAFFTLHSQQQVRVESLEIRMGDTEKSVSGLQARASSNSAWITQALTVIGVLIALFATFYERMPG